MKTKRILLRLLASVLALSLMICASVTAGAAGRTLANRTTYSGDTATLYVTKYNDSDTVYYTTNGRMPTASSAVYTEKGITVSKKTTVKMIELDRNRKKVAELNIVVKTRAPYADIKVVSSGGKNYLKLSSSLKGAKIYYTTDGSEPTKASSRYKKKIPYTAGTTVRIRVYASGYAPGYIRDYFVDDAESSGNVSDEAKAVFAIVNKERKAAGLGEYRLDPKLCELADIRAKEIVDLYSHTRPDGSKGTDIIVDSGLDYYARSENIARKQETPERVMTAWMNSADHKAAILSSKYDYIGIGHYVKDGVHYWVQLFGRK